MEYGKYLEEGDTIGFVAPSFGCNIEPYKSAFENALNTFESMGHPTAVGPNCFLGEGIGISNTPDKCALEFEFFYTGDESKVLFSCGGGELMCEILPSVDYKALNSSPGKWFIGYSDNTNLIYTLETICDKASIYGPCAPAFGQSRWHKSLDYSFDIMCGRSPVSKGYFGGYFDELISEDREGARRFTVLPFDRYETESKKDEDHPLEPYNCTEENVIRVYPQGVMDNEYKINMADHHKKARAGDNFEKGDEISRFSGRLIGGCVDCLVTLIGTRFDNTRLFLERYRDDGFIWFLEACDLNVMSIRRALWQMKNAEWFKYVKGFLIGRPLVHGQEMMGLTQYNAVIDVLKDLSVPVIMDLDIGHIPPAMPLIAGSMAEVIATDKGVGVNMFTA